MRLESRAWMCGIWFAFLAMGTWILPAGSMLMPTLRAASAAPMTPAPQDGTSAAELAELNAYFNNMLAEGAFDSPAATDARFDLNGDGVNEEIFVDPGDFLAADGRIVVTDGALHAPRYELKSPPNDMLLTSYRAWLQDCFIPPAAQLDAGMQTVVNIAGTICAGVAAGIVDWKRILNWTRDLLKLL